MVSRGGSEGPDGVLARALGALSAVMLLALIVAGFLVLRAIEDKDLAEKAQRQLEQKLVSAAPASAAPPDAPAPETSPLQGLRPACVPKEIVAESRPEDGSSAEAERLREQIAALERALASRPPPQPMEVAEAPPPTPLPPPESKPVAPPTAVAQAPSAAPDPAQAGLQAEVDRALSAIAGGALPSRDELLRVVETGPILLPLLARHFRDPDKGPAAIRIAGSLPGVRIDGLVSALSDAHGSGNAFREAATDALLDVARGGDAEALIAAAGRERLPPEIGIAVTVAVSRLNDPRADDAVAAALGRSSVEQMVATTLLVERGAKGRDVLVRALGGGRLSNEAALLVLGALLPAARESEGRTLGRAILDNDGAVAAAMKPAIGPEAAPAIAAELLSVALTPERKALLAKVLRLDAGAGQDRVVATALATPSVCQEVQEILRERGKRAPRTAAELLARAKVAEPFDVPDLLEAIDLAAPSDRALVAAVCAVFGHPEGERVLARLAKHLDPGVRMSVVTAISSSFLPDVAGILTTLLDDDDLQVASAAAVAFDLHRLALDPARGVAALERLGDFDSDCALGAMARTAGSKETLTTLLVDALDRGAINDVNASATFLMTLHESEGPEFASKFLGHREPLVRAAALRALRWTESDRDRWVSVLERVSADPDPIVRVAAARALGRVNDDIARARLIGMARDPSWIVREAALLGLASQEKVHVIPILRRAQNDRSPIVANAARVALLRQGAVDVAPDLLPDLDDPAVADRTRQVLERVAGATSRPR